MKEDDEDIVQLKLKGSGIVLLKIPVPESEILRCKLYKDKLVVKDDLVVLRTGNVKLSVESSGNTIIRDISDNDDKVDIYTGIGEAWIIHTKNIYNKTFNISSDICKENFDDDDENDEIY